MRERMRGREGPLFLLFAVPLSREMLLRTVGSHSEAAQAFSHVLLTRVFTYEGNRNPKRHPTLHLQMFFLPLRTVIRPTKCAGQAWLAPWLVGRGKALYPQAPHAGSPFSRDTSPRMHAMASRLRHGAPVRGSCKAPWRAKGQGRRRERRRAPRSLVAKSQKRRITCSSNSCR